MKLSFALKKTLAVVFFAAASAASAEPTFERRIFLLDLARQTETLPFIKAYVDHAAKAGFNAMLVYLKGVLRTKTYPLVSPQQSYSPEQMHEIVRHAESRGVEVIPYFSVLGHGEPYFKHPELVPLCEERDGDKRWQNLPKSTFCLSKPETRAWLESYIADMAEIFPSVNLHVGMDESWNMGYCRLCAPKRKEHGFGGLFTEFVNWAHETCARHGKRMWIWDDFYEFFPEEIENIPRDAVLCHWDYDRGISPHGGRGKFLNRIRRDWLAEYGRRGIETVICTWLDPDNIRTLTEYGRRNSNVKGAMLTQWETGRSFWGMTLPKLYAAGRLWSDRAVADDVSSDILDYGAGTVFSALNAHERRAAVTLLSQPRSRPRPGFGANLGSVVTPECSASVKLAYELLSSSPLACGPSSAVNPDVLSPEGLMDDLLTEWALRNAGVDFRVLTPKLVDPRRTAAQSRSAKTAVSALRARLVEIAARRRLQEAAWRPGCWPNEQGETVDKLVAYCDQLLALPETAAEDEWWVELNLHLPDFHGIPRWVIEARIGGKWREIAKGSWKPGRDGANFTRFVPFRAASAPDRVRVTYSGNGAAGLNYISMEHRGGRLVPAAVLRATGDINGAERLLTDSFDSTIFGTSDRMESFHDPALAEKKSVAELSLVSEENASAYHLDVKFDRTPAVYRAGETARVTVRLLKNSRPVGGRTAVCSWNYADTNRIEIAKSGTTIDLTLDRPGQVMLRGDVYDGTNRVYGTTACNPRRHALVIWAGALFSPELIRPTRKRPADFDTYWDGEIARLKREVPLEKAGVEVVETRPAEKGYRQFHVKIPGLPPRPTCGTLTIPEGAREKSLPAMVTFQGAGSSRAKPFYLPGAMHFCINAHGVGDGAPQKEWTAYFRADGKNYQYRGWQTREGCFFYGQIMRAVRGLEWLKTRPEWNGRDLAVEGGSMGGSQCIQAAALDPDVTLCLPRDPALCDHAGLLAKPAVRSGWPWMLYAPRNLPQLHGAGPVDPTLLAVSDYFDNVFFADRITCPVYLATGLSDDVCFSEGIYKMYNSLRGFRDVETNAHAIHCGTFNPRGEAAWRRCVK